MNLLIYFSILVFVLMQAPNPISNIKFLDKSYRKIYHCDTIRGGGLPEMAIKVYEFYEKKNIDIGTKKYQPYKIIFDSTEKYGYLLIENNRIQFLPNNYLDSLEFCGSSPQTIFDFSFCVGKEWKVCDAGIFSNSVLRLDSIVFDRIHKDSIYHISANRVFKISHKIYLANFSLSSIRGFLNFRFINGIEFGERINCRCDR